VSSATDGRHGRRSAPELEAAARQLVTRTRTEQGLPERVTDPAVLRRVAAALAGCGVAEEAS
jgi:hypothetical protein